MEDTITKSPAPGEPNSTAAQEQRRSLDKLNVSDKEKDRAKELIQRVGHRVELTPENNKRVCRKIDLRVLPVILFVYFLQALDKATLAYASVFGLIEDTNLVGNEFSWLGSIVYVAQLVAQPLVAWCLVKLPLGKFLATTVLLWGAILSIMPAAHNFGGLMATRFLLGLFEAGVAPTFIAVTQMWWRRREQPVRLGAWYAMNGITNMFGSLITYGLGHIDTPHLKSYQIIFLFFGLITVAYSVVVFFFMPDSPTKTKILNEEEKIIAIERLRQNQQGIESYSWNMAHVREAALDFKTWGWAAMMFSISVPSGGISTFGPLIIQSFGYNRFETILFNIPFGAVQIVATLGGAWVATKIRRKAPVLMFLSLPPIIGCLMLLFLPRGAGHKGPLLVAYYLISVYPGITPLIYSWSAGNTAGETKKKTTTAVLFIAQSAGNILGPNLYTPAEKPLYRRGLISNLVLFIVLILLYILQWGYLLWRNKKHASRRTAMGKNADRVDKSMNKVTERQEGDEKHEVEEVESGDNSLDDRTDFENEDFIYTY
ncbi:uncharacterized protein HMPREF1541_03464 [Cyphellophora europaea CBS 101466]|uniref:Major facilitator superfamily (MFS) profile domain-containing protein n=1 Tax=Cyphellophora europaea (strain CBS 101466) TaxID=1220924 RepID=W2S0G6_CYPE1|nr:uncharacterized protein HMPREF1541_03464 [Cyphellophora europaea CBS 101466]ETN41528.1 hypothetical protein HMPREF1541_03464 [Cyphellophora europaea CBS 101466]